MADPTLIRVWDPFIRIFHWTLVAAFAIAYLTEGEPFWLHITTGFVVAGLIAARIVWVSSARNMRGFRTSSMDRRPSSAI